MSAVEVGLGALRRGWGLDNGRDQGAVDGGRDGGGGWRAVVVVITFGAGGTGGRARS